VERAGVDRALACAVVGSPDAVRRGLQAFIGRTQADEVMITAQIFDHAARLHSFEIAADLGRRSAEREGGLTSERGGLD
jgi:alkanesulfonate monooxygenase SsuD/methylene tetrahydromethanopterin reductase-like flavin-dependent oxidoreductase (luciferase family)